MERGKDSVTNAYSGFHVGFFEKGGKSSDAPTYQETVPHYQCFDSLNTPLEKNSKVFLNSCIPFCCNRIVTLLLFMI